MDEDEWFIWFENQTILYLHKLKEEKKDENKITIKIKDNNKNKR